MSNLPPGAYSLGGITPAGDYINAAIETRNPTSSDVDFSIGQTWINKSANTAYFLTSFSTSTGTLAATWTTTAASGINTLTGDSGGAISPTSSNINLLGTANQVTTTGSGSTITWSLPSVLIAPGSLEVTTTLTVDGASTLTGNVLLSGTLGVSGLTTLAALTQVGTANINASGAGVTTIATGGTGALALGNATGNTTLTGSFSTLTAGATITLGTAAQTGLITIGSTSSTGGVTIGGSTGAQTLNFGTGGTGVKTIHIGDGAAANVLTIGSTTASASLALQSGSGGNTTISGDVAATITIGNAAQTGKISVADSTAAMPAVDLMNGVASGTQVLNVASGTSATGAQVVNILNGTTPGANTTLNIMNGAGSAGTQVIAALSTGATRAGTYNIGDGGAAHVGVIGSTTASASLTLQAGSGTTGLKFNAAGNVQMPAATGSNAGVTLTLNARVAHGVFTGQTTASGASQAFVITNSVITGTNQTIFVSVDNLGSNDAQMTITRVLQAASTLTVTLKNNGAAALNGDVHINWWILD